MQWQTLKIAEDAICRQVQMRYDMSTKGVVKMVKVKTTAWHSTECLTCEMKPQGMNWLHGV